MAFDPEGGPGPRIQSARSEMRKFFDGANVGSVEFMAAGHLLIRRLYRAQRQAYLEIVQKGESEDLESAKSELRIAETQLAIVNFTIQSNAYTVLGYLDKFKKANGLVSEMERAIRSEGSVDSPNASALNELRRAMNQAKSQS